MIPHRFIDTARPLGSLSAEYLEHMLTCNRRQAAALVSGAVASGTTVRDIYLEVLQPAQYELGWLWQSGRISVGQEHYCTNATQLVMTQLYPQLFSGRVGGRKLLATCVQGELHELGLRMLADFFELEGWDTQFLGANMPIDGVVSVLESWKADVVAVGVTMHYHLEAARALISALRAATRGRDILFLVGGYSCREVPGIWRKLGADAFAPDALTAIDCARRHFEGSET